MRVLLDLPRLVFVQDYHELPNYTNVLKQLGTTGVRVSEVGFVNGQYVGLIYTGTLTEAKRHPNVVEKLNKIRKDVNAIAEGD